MNQARGIERNADIGGPSTAFALQNGKRIATSGLCGGQPTARALPQGKIVEANGLRNGVGLGHHTAYRLQQPPCTLPTNNSDWPIVPPQNVETACVGTATR